MIIITLFFHLLSGIKGDINSVNFGEYENFRPTILIQFMNENTQSNILLNTYLPISVTHLVYGKYRKDNILTNQTLYLGFHYQSVLYKTDILINDKITINNLLTYNVNKENVVLYKDQGLALGYHIKDESFSIVHQLYQKNIINHLQFAFKNLYRDSGKLFFGGIPNNVHLSLPYKVTIKVDETLPTWGFTIKKIIFNGVEYDIDIPAIISSAADSFFISDDLYNLFDKTILRQSIKKGLCNLRQKDHERYIKCSLSVLGNPTSLVINEITFKFSSEIFSDNNGGYGLVASNYYDLPRKAHNFTGIILGPQFISLFNYTIFDYENKQVEFYSDTTIIELSNKKNIKTKIVLCIHIIILLLNFILLIYTKHL